VKVGASDTKRLLSLSKLVLSGVDWFLQYIGFYEYLYELVGVSQKNRLVPLARLVLSSADWCLL